MSKSARSTSSARVKRKAAAPKSHKPTESEIAEAFKRNWGAEAAKTIAKFRRIWEKEGVRLA